MSNSLCEAVEVTCAGDKLGRSAGIDSVLERGSVAIRLLTFRDLGDGNLIETKVRENQLSKMRIAHATRGVTRECVNLNHSSRLLAFSQ